MAVWSLAAPLIAQDIWHFVKRRLRGR
jgi:hypothetical protein